MLSKSLLVLPFLFTANLAHSRELIDKTVAVVNDDIITISDQKTFEKKLASNSMIDELLLLGRTVDELKKNKEAQLEFMINEKIVNSEIKRLNLSVTMERVEQEIREIAKRNNVSRNDMMNAIKAQGVSVSDYQDFVKSRIERQNLIESEISNKIRVNDEDVMGEYLRKNPAGDKTVYEYTLAQILFSPSKGGVAAAQERGQKVLEKLKAGESFEILVQQHTEDPSVANNGTLGTFKTGEFSKEFEDAIRNLSVGQTTPLIRTKSGFHILKLTNKKLVSDPQFEASKEKYRNELFEKAFKRHFALWIEHKKEESFIRINR